jgi:hypothetical protein
MTNGIIAKGGHLGGGERWMTAIPGQQTTAPTIQLIGHNGGHNGVIVVRGVDLQHVYHRKYPIRMLYFMRLCPNGMHVCWDEVLQRLWCLRHCVAGRDVTSEVALCLLLT